MSDTTPSSPPNELDMSLVAGNVLSHAVQAIRHLFCPFCGERSLFEHELKAHLKEAHAEQLKKYTKPSGTEDACPIDDEFVRNNSCPFCSAQFLLNEILPRHIADQHGIICLKIWQQRQQQLEQITDSSKSAEPTIVYAHCSPGLSELFDKISTAESVEKVAKSPLKSILKKTNTKSAAHRIICSPSSAGIRRAKNTTLVRRSSSARRELRFEFGDENEPLADYVMPKVKVSNDKMQTKQRRRRGCLMNGLLFGRCVSSQKKKSPRGIVTSTPNNLLDECDATENLVDDKSWGPQRNKPLFSLRERFQCAHCNSAWENNAELLTHLTEKHKNVRRWFQPDYRCGTCATKFFSNRFLVRHCHAHHTPPGKRSN